MRTSPALPLLLAACGGAGPISADQVLVDGETLTVVVARLEAQAAQARASAAEADAAAPADPGDVAAQLHRLDERLTNVELAIANLEQHGIERSAVVSYDPRATKLAATNVQDALTELEGRLGSIEGKVLDDLGKPGPGLFDTRNGPGGVRKTGPGRGGPPPGNGGPQGGPGGGPEEGPGGPPPQGGGGGQQKGGGQQNGGGGQQQRR
jgi:hypothetical protein